MSTQVPASEIEAKVGCARQATVHIANASYADDSVTVMHSLACLARQADLRTCVFAIAQDRGLDHERWWNFEGVPMVVEIEDGRLVPVREATSG